MQHVNYISIELEEENFCVEFEKPLRHSEKKGKQYFFKSGAGKEIRGLQCLSGKDSAYNAGDTGSTSLSGRSPGEGNGNPLQYSCLGHPMDRGAWLAPWGPRSQIQLDN